ncbi:MAG: phosphoribosylformylglycinamidine synthase II [Rhodospirillaceae bacterium]|nr:phosphoribosylformylglycinamidine synthase II [Rhodospirillaceae bacterium]|tara:strand:- start:2074 stop:4290 length:2217 start_codon:yes stop_codon:yes gene_type:complete
MIGDHDRISTEVVEQHGLSIDEFSRIKNILDREPTLTELGIFSSMWSEHCSYKSSKKWLKILPTEGDHVIQGPGENAGVISIGDGLAAVFKIESHNHPSFIEPYQGAATGVGGILRDVFTMGARPIANLNALRFGSPDHPKTRHLLSGVVSGIGGYGNCIGVPTVGGEVNFHPAYNGNILVNAMTVGVADSNNIFYSVAAGSGNPVIYVGAKTGRDGIHGATMSSAEFNEDAEEKRPTVQVGDPFTEKLLLEACLELMDSESIIAIQDMGAAGLTSSSVEMAGKGGLGMKLNLDLVPVREEAMSAYEIMLSESQERMLMVLRPESKNHARNIFKKWGLDFAVIGELTQTGHLEIVKNGLIKANIPIDPMVDQSPEYDRPWTSVQIEDELDSGLYPPKDSFIETLKKLIASPDIASRRWIWEQFDYLIMNNTLARPGGDAAVVRVPDTAKALAITVDCTPRYCLSNPTAGGRQAVAEAWRNVTATGAKPMALTNNMNFGNPEKAEIMGQFVECIKGMKDAAEQLAFPIVSGNVSLYNETNGKAILPTPVIGGVGLLENYENHTTIDLKKAGEDIILVGSTAGWLGQSLYLREIHNLEIGGPPPTDLQEEKRNGDFIRNIILDKHISACHDISDGGLLIAVAEMALASVSLGNPIGVSLSIPNRLTDHAFYFGEDQGRYLITTDQPDRVFEIAATKKVSVQIIGKTDSANLLTLEGIGYISLSEIHILNEKWMPEYMNKV